MGQDPGWNYQQHKNTDESNPSFSPPSWWSFAATGIIAERLFGEKRSCIEKELTRDLLRRFYPLK